MKMKKFPYSYLFFLLISLPAVSQTSKRRSTSTVVYKEASLQASAKTFVPTAQTDIIDKKSKFAPANLNIDAIAFFGNFEKTETQKQKDENFLKDCELNFENREEASKFFAARAWEYLNEGQADTAIYRFNLAWMLNPKNIDTYWGLGVIAYQKENLKDAIAFMESGHKLDEKNTTLSVDLATVRIQCYLKDKDSTDLITANNLLQNVIIIEPTSANAYMKLSLLNLVEGNFNNAWTEFHRAYDMDVNSLDIELLSALLEKSPDPKGKFYK